MTTHFPFFLFKIKKILYTIFHVQHPVKHFRTAFVFGLILMIDMNILDIRIFEYKAINSNDR